MAPLDVVLATWTFDLGGTEKSHINHALAFDRERVRPRMVAIGQPGRRDDELRAAGLPVDCAHDDGERLAELLRGADVVHVSRGGLADPLLPAARRAAGVPVMVETNVFGLYDTSADEREFGCHLLISQMCAMRYRRAQGLDFDAFDRRHRVLYNPIDVDRLRALAPEPRAARGALGLDPDRPTVGRVGRADDRKWSPLLIGMLPALLARVPDAQVLLVGLTDERRRQLRRLGLEDRVHAIEPTADEARLATIYAACDVLAAGSSIGESFGVSMAEAMALGVPVVTHSTPWADNAQVEVVEHGRTGLVANHPRVFGEAVARLLADPAERQRMGAAGRADVDARFAAGPVTRQLESLYEALLADGRPPAAWLPDIRALEAFERDYPRRAAAQLRPLTRRERVEARAAVLAERAGWLLRDARADPARVARAGAAAVAARLRAARG
ncbi:MAG TPA: glycosyltransferase family 4 protein [Baekduia sp.]|nr:glycosyltransferase family 4 protein [Baekduia sp.]